MKLAAILLILSGAAARYLINRRNFNRRNQFGTQGFKSYEHSQFTRFTETIIKLTGLLLIIAGILLFLLSLAQPYQHPKKTSQLNTAIPATVITL